MATHRSSVAQFPPFRHLVPFAYIIASTTFAFIALLSGQRVRCILSIAILACAIRSLDKSGTNPHLDSVFGLFVLLWLLHIFNILLVQQLVIDGQTRRERCLVAYKWLFNGRWLPVTSANTKRILSDKAGSSAKVTFSDKPRQTIKQENGQDVKQNTGEDVCVEAEEDTSDGEEVTAEEERVDGAKSATEAAKDEDTTGNNGCEEYEKSTQQAQQYKKAAQYRLFANINLLKPHISLPILRPSPLTIFILQRLTLALTLYYLNSLYETHLINTQRPHLYNHLTILDFTPQKTTYIRRLNFSPFPPTTPLSATEAITTRETILRILMVIHYFWTAFYTFTGLHAALSVLFVGLLRLDEPKDWPRLYGSLGATYTIRGFWRGFWHRIVHKTYLCYGRAILKCLGISVDGYGARVGLTGFVFFMSGVMHALVERYLGMCGYRGSLYWFLQNFGAIVVEDVFLSVAKKTMGSRFCGWRGWRVVGYGWVWGFMFWSVPKDQFEKIYCSVMGGSV